MKIKSTRATLIAILASILSYGIAQACSPVDPTIIVKCSNLEVSIGADIPPEAGDTYEDIQNRRTTYALKNLQTIVLDCEEDLRPVLASFEQEIIKFLDYRNRNGTFIDGDLILEPYSIEKDLELQIDKNRLLSCGYNDSKHVGNWLIIFETSRTYCYDYWPTGGGWCPSTTISLEHFLLYLVTNFNLTTAPYLAGLLLVIVASIYFMWKLLKNRPVMKLWKIIALTIVILASELFLIVLPFWLIGQIIGWSSLFYILVLWYNQLKHKKFDST